MGESIQTSTTPQHRADVAHDAIAAFASRAEAKVTLGADATIGSSEGASATYSGDSSESLRSLLPEHSEDLISRLQAWSESLDKREAELNARYAMLEHFERTTRMQIQTQSQSLEEQERALVRKRQNLETQLKRAALGNISFADL